MIYTKYIKRFFDVSSAGLFLVIFSWLLIFIALGHRITNGGILIFSQVRIGRNLVPFRIYKFRTLSEKVSLPLQKRQFAWGNFLRFTNLDELPQLWNIVKGEMSWVGPRPLPVEYLGLMSEDQKLRHKVRPGITGWTQVNGRHSISWQKKFELDIFYVNHISFRLDTLILFKTIVLLLSFKKDKSLIEEKFKGN